MASKLWVGNQHIIIQKKLKKKLILGSLSKVQIFFSIYDDHFFSTNRHMANPDPWDVNFSKKAETAVDFGAELKLNVF